MDQLGLGEDVYTPLELGRSGSYTNSIRFAVTTLRVLRWNYDTGGGKEGIFILVVSDISS